jgi:cell division protease FtsH
MKPGVRRVVFFAVLIGVAAMVWWVVRSERNQPKTTYSQFMQQVESGEVNKATIVAGQTGANQVTYSLKDGSQVRTMLPSNYRDALEAMQQKMVDIEIRDGSTQSLRMLANASPFLILVGVWFFVMRRLPPGRRLGGLL